MKRFKKLIIILFVVMVITNLSVSTAQAAKAKSKVRSLGTYKITFYCPCRRCSGRWGTRTASGRRARAGRTVAVDRRYIKLGTKLRIDGKWYVAEDTGVRGKHIDIYVSKHSHIPRYGKKYRKIYVRR
ncbi:hypothetical protein P261_01160 [Lachnospiraceae bacterium TWA4]|nr:hypothetical protein P261_01160 [Lachnospiraceae bacterium TWA4]